MKKFTRSFLLAATGAAMVGLIALVLFRSKQPAAPFELADIRIMLVFLLSLFVVAFISLLFVGVPTTLLFSKLKLERPWTYPTVGFVTGFAVSLLYLELPLRGSESMIVSATGGLAGLTAGVIWWATNRRTATVEKLRD